MYDGSSLVREAIEAAPIAPLSLDARAVGAVGTITLPKRMADTVAVVTSCVSTAVDVKFCVTLVVVLVPPLPPVPPVLPLGAGTIGVYTGAEAIAAAAA